MQLIFSYVELLSIFYLEKGSKLIKFNFFWAGKVEALLQALVCALALAFALLS
jgi:hypothetical protein